MPPKERSAKEKEEERNKILEAALELINAEGFDALSMRKIAKTLNFSATKIYNYFHNKDEVYIAIAVESYKIFVKILEEDLKGAQTSDEKVARMIRCFFRFSEDYRNNYEILFEQKAPRYRAYIGTPLEEIAKEKMTVGIGWFNYYTGILNEYIQDHGLDQPGDMDAIGLLFFSHIHGLVSLYHNRLIQEISDDAEAFMEGSVSRLIKDFEKIIL